jgi:hypothetical protein
MKKVIIVNPYAGSFSDELKTSNVEELNREQSYPNH